MLDKIRKPSRLSGGIGIKKIFAYTFFALICFILVLFMPVTSQLVGGSGAVAHVEKQSISSREYNLFFNNLKKRYADRLDKASLEETQRLENQIQKRALDQLINRYVIAEAAGSEGFFVTNKAVQQTIQSLDFFQEEGRFIYSRYRNLLKNQKIAPAVFEERIRRDILTQNWRDLFFTALQSNALEKKKSQNPFQVSVRFAPIKEELSADEKKHLTSLLQTKESRPATGSFLKKFKLKWKTLSHISPSHQHTFQFDSNEMLMKAVLNHLPKTGFVPGLIPGGDKQYVAEVLSFQNSPSNGEATQNQFSLLLNYEKPLSLFEVWFENKKQAANIQINNKYFNRP